MPYDFVFTKGSCKKMVYYNASISLLAMHLICLVFFLKATVEREFNQADWSN